MRPRRSDLSPSVHFVKYSLEKYTLDNQNKKARTQRSQIYHPVYTFGNTLLKRLMYIQSLVTMVVVKCQEIFSFFKLFFSFAESELNTKYKILKKQGRLLFMLSMNHTITDWFIVFFSNLNPHTEFGN